MFKRYKLLVSSDFFKTDYVIYSDSLQNASKQAKLKFGKQFNEIGSNVRVSLQYNDLSNHINEILSKICNGGR